MYYIQRPLKYQLYLRAIKIPIGIVRQDVFFLFFVLQMTSKYDYSIMTRTMSCNEVYAIVLWLSQEILIKSQVFY